MYANGKLWGALDTALNPDGGPQRAGIAWYIVNPAAGQGRPAGLPRRRRLRLHLPGDRRHAERPWRDGVHRTRATRSTRAPRTRRSTRTSASARGTSSPAAQGAAPDDGFTSYKSQVGNPPRTRWGDYGAAAVDGNSIWIASEYIAHACDYTDVGRPVLRRPAPATTCSARAAAIATGAAGPRAALGNWSTRISKFTP